MRISDWSSEVCSSDLGIAPVERVVVEEPVGAVLAKSVTHTFNLVGMMIEGLEQVITGRRPVDELGGPIKIAQFAGQTASLGWEPLIEFMAFISINLGFINLLPVPMLDGGQIGRASCRERVCQYV